MAGGRNRSPKTPRSSAIWESNCMIASGYSRIISKRSAMDWGAPLMPTMIRLLRWKRGSSSQPGSSRNLALPATRIYPNRLRLIAPREHCAVQICQPYFRKRPSNRRRWDSSNSHQTSLVAGKSEREQQQENNKQNRAHRVLKNVKSTVISKLDIPRRYGMENGPLDPSILDVQ